MPKSKEFVAESDSGSGDDVPKKKVKVAEEKVVIKSSKEASKDEDDKMFPLGKNKFATVGEFRNSKFVNIREYYEKDGELKPGKKGIALSMDQWGKLKDQLDSIDNAIEKL